MLGQSDAIAAIAKRISEANPRFAVLCARGSSGHVTVFMRYLLEARLGRVYLGLMVHMRARNNKLRRRAERMVAQVTTCSAADAARYVEQADGDVKTAILLGAGMKREDAVAALARHGGNLRPAIDEFRGKNG